MNAFTIHDSDLVRCAYSVSRCTISVGYSAAITINADRKKKKKFFFSFHQVSRVVLVIAQLLLSSILTQMGCGDERRKLKLATKMTGERD